MKFIDPSVGNDPELFVTEKGKLVPAEKLKLSEEKEMYRGVKVDNAAVELNFPAQHCLQYNLGEIARTLVDLKKAIKPRVHKISLSPAMEIEPEDMQNCKSLLQFGCSPSLVFEGDALRTSVPNVDPREIRYRSIGFHVHLGYAKPKDLAYLSMYNDESYKEKKQVAELLHTTEGRVRLVQACDYVVGLPAIFLERDDKAVQIRRRLLGYGRAGEFREQPHGFEYRTLGPWPMVGPSWVWWANSAVRDALQLVLMDADIELIKKIPAQKVSDAINNNDLGMALELWTKIKKALDDVATFNTRINNKHAILGKNNIKMLEYVIARGGLSGKKFSFSSWPHYHGEYTSIRRGFPYRIKRWVHNPKNLPSFMEYCNKWEFTKDNISQYI
jgi:phiEco32-like amidoligase-type 2 protein